MNAFWRDRLNNTRSYLHCAFYIYRSKVGAYYRSTLFADLNLAITQFCRKIAAAAAIFLEKSGCQCEVIFLHI